MVVSTNNRTYIHIYRIMKTMIIIHMYSNIYIYTIVYNDIYIIIFFHVYIYIYLHTE